MYRLARCSKVSGQLGRAGFVPETGRRHRRKIKNGQVDGLLVVKSDLVKKTDVIVTWRRLFDIIKVNVVLCRWIQGGRGGKSTPGISEYNNFVDDKKGQHNYFCLYSIDKLLYELDVLLDNY
jgi:hypothetical protein